MYLQFFNARNYIYSFHNFSLRFILKIFLKFRKFQPRYSYKIYSYKKKKNVFIMFVIRRQDYLDGFVEYFVFNRYFVLISSCCQNFCSKHRDV